MTDFADSLDKSSYSWKNALFWGNFVVHCRKTKEGNLGNRLVHAFIAVLELFSIVSQISLIFEKLIIDNFYYAKFVNYSFTDKKISKKADPSSTQSVSQLFSQSNKSDIYSSELNLQHFTRSGPEFQAGLADGDAASLKVSGLPTPLHFADSAQMSILDKSQAPEDENPLSSSLNFQNKPGRHTIKSPVVGSRANELLAVKKAMKSESILTKLQEAIYKDIYIYI